MSLGSSLPRSVLARTKASRFASEDQAGDSSTPSPKVSWASFRLKPEATAPVPAAKPARNTRVPA